MGVLIAPMGACGPAPGGTGTLTSVCDGAMPGRAVEVGLSSSLDLMRSSFRFFSISSFFRLYASLLAIISAVPEAAA